MIWKSLLTFFLEKIYSVVVTAITDYLEKRKLRKEIKEKVKEITNEEDAQTRAKRIKDLLNS